MLFLFAIINHGLSIGFLLIFSSSVWTTFSRGQYLCWCVTDRTLLILPPQFKIHKSSGHFLVDKRCSLIDQYKHKDLISLIRKRTQQYQYLIFNIDYCIQVYQIHEKFHVNVDVFTNGGSSLQLKMIKSLFQMQAVLNVLRQLLARESLPNFLRRSLIYHIII